MSGLKVGHFVGEGAFILDGKPIPKARPRVTHSGRAFTPKATRDYELSIAEVGRQAMSGRSPVSEPVTLSVKAFFPIPTSWTKPRQAMALDGTLAHTVRPDGSNILKSVEDGLNGIVYQDDSQIVISHIEKYYSDRPRIEVTITPYKGKE